MKKLILASSSPSRKQILQNTGAQFQTISPNIDESFQDHCVEDFVQRLSQEKALAGWDKFVEQNHKSDTKVTTQYFILGCDQVAVCNGKIFGKPHNQEKAIEFLSEFSGKKITYLSGLALYHPQSHSLDFKITSTEILFRDLTLPLIKTYILVDEPLFCAGALKVESMGTSLIKSYQCEDPTAITGLPLVTLNNLLSKHNLSLIDFHAREYPSIV